MERVGTVSRRLADDLLPRRWDRVLCVAVLLVAAGLRFWALGEVPPGLAHDEVANWLIARDILAGRHAIYFTAAYGHEPLYQYLQAGTVALFGDHWLGLRYPSAALGLIGLAVTAALLRRLFGRTVALLGAAYLALGFWPLFYARVALRALALPVTAGLATFFLFAVLRRPPASARRRWLAAGGLGLFLGLSFYTYMAARVLPLVLGVYVGYLALLHRDRLRGRWRQLLMGAAIAAGLAAPLLIWLAAHPGAEVRVAEVREPLDRLLQGDPSLVWQNLVANLGMFIHRGDPWPRQNLAGRPVFPDLLNAALFCLGVGIALWRWRDRRYAFLLIWLLLALVPSIFTAVAPSSIRDILALVVVFAFPAIALAWLAERLSALARSRWRPAVGRLGAGLLLSVPLLLYGLCTVRDYFVRWPQDEVVRFDYQTALTAAARRVDELGPDVPVVVAGLSVDTMDGPGIELAARGPTAQVRLCDPRETLVLPAGAEGRLLVPEVVTFDADLRDHLLRWGGRVVGPSEVPFEEIALPGASEVVGALPETVAFQPDGLPVSLPASFDGHLELVGVEWLHREASPGGRLVLLTFWRVESPPVAALKAFVHLLDATGRLRAQHDGLRSPYAGWAGGDLIVQRHVLDLPTDLEPGAYSLQLGLYWEPEGPRLSVGGADRLLLRHVVVEVP